MKTQYSKSDIQVFIFNWKDYYKKTCHIESSLKKIISDVSIINTNDSNFSEHWINIGEEHYFSGQMRAMLKHHNPEKIVLIILADIQFENWEGLISDAIKYSDQYNWGIYTPEIDFTPHKTNKVSLPYHRYLDHNLRAVSCSDGLVWFIHPYILMQFKQRSYDQLFDQSIYGWGWDHILNSLCYILKKPVIKDLNHVVLHPKTRGYNGDLALTELRKILNHPKLSWSFRYTIKSSIKKKSLLSAFLTFEKLHLISRKTIFFSNSF